MSELEIFWRTTGALIIVFTFLFGTMWLTIFLPKMKFLCRWFGHKIGGGYYIDRQPGDVHHKDQPK